MINRLFASILLLLVSTTFVFANVYRYRVYLDGKPDSQPVALSERAMENRQRLQIETDEADYDVSTTYLQQLRDAGLTILTRSRWLNTAVVMLGEGSEVPTSVWSKLPFVLKVEMLTMPDVQKASLRLTPGREVKATTTLATLEDCTTPLREVNAYDALYVAGYRGQGKIIAVFDGGFLRLNECNPLKDKVVFTHNLYNPTLPESVYSKDTHGIQCMSIMACPEVDGVCGTAVDANYALFCTEVSEFESSLEEDMWVAAAEMVDSLGFDIISSSLGYSEFNKDLLSHTQEELTKDCVLISRGAKIACQKGILVVSSAGNYGNKSWKKLLFPADVEEVLTVGAYTPLLEPAAFTSEGFLSPYVKPDIAARGTNCYTIFPVENGFDVRRLAQGTSFSTPLIAGLCASLWSAVPELTPAELRQVLHESASDYADPNDKTGYGLPDFSIALAKAQELKGYNSIEDIKIEAADGGSTASNEENRYINLFGQPVSAASQGVIIEQSGGRKRILSKP